MTLIGIACLSYGGYGAASVARMAGQLRFAGRTTLPFKGGEVRLGTARVKRGGEMIKLQELKPTRCIGPLPINRLNIIEQLPMLRDMKVPGEDMKERFETIQQFKTFTIEKVNGRRLNIREIWFKPSETRHFGTQEELLTLCAENNYAPDNLVHERVRALVRKIEAGEELPCLTGHSLDKMLEYKVVGAGMTQTEFIGRVAIHYRPLFTATTGIIGTLGIV